MHGDLVLLYRVVRDQDIVFRDELSRLARDRGIRVCYVVGDHDDHYGRQLMSPEHLRQLVPDIAEREIYLCGPPAMMDVLESNVRHAGVPARYIHTERFAL
jgi:ferredoxin-NADP reductase